MSLDVIKSYLVALGFSVDNASYGKMQQALKDLDKKIVDGAGNMARSYAAAASTIAGAIVSITTATAGLLDNLAQTDLEYKKYALHMYMAADAAKRMKISTDALGESLNDIAWMPELRDRYFTLQKQQQGMEPPKSYEQEMRHLRDVRFEFTRFRVEMTYGAQWIGHYLYKYLNSEIRDFDGWLKKLNQYIDEKMPTWTEKVAKFLTVIINMGGSAWRALKDIGGVAGDLWNKLSDNQKALVAVGAMLLLFKRFKKIGLLGWFTLLITAIDDFYAYIDGRKSNRLLAPIWYNLLNMVHALQSAFGSLWKAFGLAKEGKWTEAGNVLKEAWGNLNEDMKDLGAHNKSESEFIEHKKQLFITENWSKWRSQAGLGWLAPLDEENMKKVAEQHKAEIESQVPGWKEEYKQRTGKADRVQEEMKQRFRRHGDIGGLINSGTALAGITRVESGGDYNASNPHSGARGKYQIMPGTWRQFASMAGLPSGAPMTPENQERVARTMNDYYSKKYNGDPRLIAAAWYGGEGVADALKAGRMSKRAFNRLQYSKGHAYPSIADYIKNATGQEWDLNSAAQTYQSGINSAYPSIQSRGGSSVTITRGDTTIHVDASGTGGDPQKIADKVKEAIRSEDNLSSARTLREFQPVYS